MPVQKKRWPDQVLAWSHVRLQTPSLSALAATKLAFFAAHNTLFEVFRDHTDKYWTYTETPGDVLETFHQLIWPGPVYQPNSRREIVQDGDKVASELLKHLDDLLVPS
jgi:hypothetical protein